MDPLTPAPISSEAASNAISKAVTVNNQFFPLEQHAREVKMVQNYTAVVTSPRAPSFGSGDSLLLDSPSLRSHGFAGLDSPRYTKSPELSHAEFFTLKSPQEFAAPEPHKQELMVPDFSLNVAFSEHQLSSQASSVIPRQDEVSEELLPTNVLLKLTFFRKKMKKVAKAHSAASTSWSILESAKVNSTSTMDVMGAGADNLQHSDRKPGFYYIHKALTATSSNSGEESDSRSQEVIEVRPFAAFLDLCKKMTTKEAFCRKTVLSVEKVNREFDLALHTADTVVEGEWSGDDVRSSHDTSKIDDDTPMYSLLNQFKYTRWKPGFAGTLQKLQTPFRTLVDHSVFNIFFTVCVILNTIVLAINHYGIEKEWSDALDTCNLVFTIIFCVEMGLKMIGLGIVGYFLDKMNIFDFIVVTLSLVELSFMSGSGLSALRAIRVFRAFRALRVARLFRSMKYMQKILEMIGKSIENFMYMGLLLFLFMVVFALFGMQLFGGEFDFPDGKPRSNYDNFHYAFLTTFQILTMENWFEILYSGMRTSIGNWASLYFVIWIFFGNFVLLNLFLAILLDSFSNLSDEDEINLQTISEMDDATVRMSTNLSKRKQRKLESIIKKIEEIKEEESIESESASLTIERGAAKKKAELFLGNGCKRSYFILSKTSPLRIWCFRITSSSRFEWGIMVLIFVSSMKLIWETYLFDEPVGSVKLEVSANLDLVFTILFTIEFLLKSISLGFVLGRGTYLRDAWNILDFIIVLFSLLDVTTTSGVNLKIIKVFRLLRALRPLRFISHNKSMRIIVNALLESFIALANVAVVILIVWLIFAILGVTLLMGKEYTCSNTEITDETECLYYGFQWVNSPNHFDNVIVAYQSLFILTSQENWPDQMYQGADAYEIGKSMRENTNPAMAYFFVLFEMVSNVFFLNLLLGVMFDKFEKSKRSNTSITELLLQNDQLRWVQMMKYMIRTKRESVEAAISSRLQLIVHNITKHWTFSSFIMGCILGNMVTMALAYDEASPTYSKTLENLNLTFTGIFCLEALLKIYGLTVQGYFRDRWNCFDFFVVASSLLDIILSLTVFSSGSNKILTVGPQLARTLRILRVSRLFRLVKRLKMIDELVGMMSLSIPAIMNVSALLVLVYTIYGVLGVYLFHYLENGMIVDDYNNFSNFGMAVLVLIRTSTGEDWNYLEWDASEQTSPVIATFYFQSFVSLTTFIMYNMFIMVMLQEYENYHNNPSSSSLFHFNESLKKFNEAWNSSSPMDKKSRLDGEGLIAFAYSMGADIKVDDTMSKFEVKKHLNLLGITLDEQGFIYYHDALFRCFRKMFGVRGRIKEQVQRKLLEKEEVIHMKKIRKMVKIDKLSSVKHFMQQSAKGTSDTRLMDLIFLKSVFSSWKGYARNRKDASASLTPPMSLNNPGVNSLELSIEESEKEKADEPAPRTSQQTLQLPTATSEQSTARDVKFSRTSTNFSRLRNDTQE